MTNLVEKSLIVGFGIFVLIIFIGFITPFFKQAEEFNKEDRDAIDDYLDFIEQLDNAIKSVIEDPNKLYHEDIQCLENLDVLIEDNFVKLYFLYDNEDYYKILEYSICFFNDTFDSFITDEYTLQISFPTNYSFIKIIFTN